MTLRIVGIQLFRQLRTLQPSDCRGYVYPEMEFKIILSGKVQEIAPGQTLELRIDIPGQCDVEMSVRYCKEDGRMSCHLRSSVLDRSLHDENWAVYGPALEADITPDLSMRTQGYPIGSRPRQSGKTLEMQKQLDELGYVTVKVGGFNAPHPRSAYYSLDHIAKADLPTGKLHHEVSHPDPNLLGPDGIPKRADIGPVDWDGMLRRRHVSHNSKAPVVTGAFQALPSIDAWLLDWSKHLNLTHAPIYVPTEDSLDKLEAEFNAMAYDIEAGILEAEDPLFMLYPHKVEILDVPGKGSQLYAKHFMGEEFAKNAFLLDSISPPTYDHRDFIGDTLLTRKQAKRQFFSMFPRNPNPTVLDEHGNGKKRHEPFVRDRYGKHGGPKGRKGRSKK